LFSKYSQSQIIFSLNLTTSSITIIHHFSTLSRTRSKKSLVLLFIQSIKTKSYFSFKFGIISRAFQFIAFIISETQANLKLLIAVSYDDFENSIVVNLPQTSFNSKAKFIALYQLAVQISNIFLVFWIFIRSLKNLAFTSEMFGILFCIQCSLSSFKKKSISIF
jgi:hypothetical protein